MRDFRAELAGDKCWDRVTEALVAEHGEPLEDAILQNREELIGLCELIERERIESYLEIGVWTGALVRTLHRLFRFRTVAACDQGYAETLGLAIRLPDGARFFRGNSESDGFQRFRAALGHVDLTLVDANHAHHAVARDFAINRAHPHRFLAFHDITGGRRQTTGVARFWRELEGDKLEIVRPHRELDAASTMGIGVWRS